MPRPPPGVKCQHYLMLPSAETSSQEDSGQTSDDVFSALQSTHCQNETMQHNHQLVGLALCSFSSSELLTLPLHRSSGSSDFGNAASTKRGTPTEKLSASEIDMPFHIDPKRNKIVDLHHMTIQVMAELTRIFEYKELAILSESSAFPVRRTSIDPDCQSSHF